MKPSTEFLYAKLKFLQNYSTHLKFSTSLSGRPLERTSSVESQKGLPSGVITIGYTVESTEVIGGKAVITPRPCLTHVHTNYTKELPLPHVCLQGAHLGGML